MKMHGGNLLLLLIHLVALYHHYRVICAFHLAQSGVAKVLFAVGIYKFGMFRKNVVYKEPVYGFACSGNVVVGFFNVYEQSVVEYLAECECRYPAIDAQNACRLLVFQQVSNCCHTLPMFVATHIVFAIVLALSVACKKLYHIGNVVGSASVICICRLLCNEFVIAVTLLVQGFALKGGKLLYVIYVIAPVFKLFALKVGEYVSQLFDKLLRYCCKT